MASDSRVPAFPSTPPGQRHEGMSQREWYAGLALQGIVAAGEVAAHHDPNTIADQAFELADAMMSKITRDTGE